MNFYTSDQHFGHINILKMNNRPFQNIEEMDNYLIQAWNLRITPTDNIYILGDLIYKSRLSPEHYLSRLNGKKYLIIGNHDVWYRRNPDKFAPYFQFVGDYLDISDCGQRVILMHYPILRWNAMRRGSIHLHGHSHHPITEVELPENMRNVCVDAAGYFPLTLKELISIPKG